MSFVKAYIEHVNKGTEAPAEPAILPVDEADDTSDDQPIEG